MQIDSVFYLCNGNRWDCRNSKDCYKNGGECRYTTDIENSKNFFLKTSCVAVNGREEVCNYWEER